MPRRAPSPADVHRTDAPTVTPVAREGVGGPLTWRNGGDQDTISPAGSTVMWQPRHT